MIRFGLIGKLKREKIEYYRALHADPCPAVVAAYTAVL